MSLKCGHICFALRPGALRAQDSLYMPQVTCRAGGGVRRAVESRPPQGSVPPCEDLYVFRQVLQGLINFQGSRYPRSLNEIVVLIFSTLITLNSQLDPRSNFIKIS